VHSKILTLDNLGRMGMVVVNRCWLCESDGESVDHHLLHCVAASSLWTAFFAWFGLCWVMPRSVSELVDRRSYEERCCLEDGSSLYHVVCLEGAQ
jgi:uncharacterized membrane protein